MIWRNIDKVDLKHKHPDEASVRPVSLFEQTGTKMVIMVVGDILPALSVAH